MNPVKRTRQAFDLASSFVAGFHPTALRPMLRANYARELTSWTFMPIMLTGINAGAMGVILKKTFTDLPGTTDSGLALAVGTVGAATAIGNLTSTIWASLSTGRNKVNLIVLLMVACSLCVGAISLVPASNTGAWMMASLVLIGWIFWSGVITTRASVWRANYPGSDRTSIAGRLASVQAVISALSVFVVAKLLDGFSAEDTWGTRLLDASEIEFIEAETIERHAFRVIFPMLAIFGLLGASVYARVRLRGQSRLARVERTSRGGSRSILEPLKVFGVLHRDRNYRNYIICQFIFGAGNLLMMPVLALILISRFDATYLESLLVTAIIPPILMPLAIPMWAKLLSGMHVISYRAIHSWIFVVAGSCFLVGSVFTEYWIIVMGSAVLGIGWAGGVLAWNLGHQHFAKPERDTEYMSVHVVLTGVRGAIAPYLGVALYEMLKPNGHESWVFGVAALLSSIGAIGFLILFFSQRRMIREWNASHSDAVGSE